MRMRELEQRAGVGRETIRYYIREGLLPEPAKASRNSARYSEEHVIRLKAIKRLQEERFLPLSVIKALLNADNRSPIDIEAFPHLEDLLLARMDMGQERLSLVEVSQQSGLLDNELEDMARVGVIILDKQKTMDRRDAAIATRWGDLRKVGFTPDRGFTPDEARFYVEFIEWLTSEEIRLFFGHMTGQAGEDEIVEAAEQGITVMNEVLSLMRTRALLRHLEQLKQKKR